MPVTPARPGSAISAQKPLCVLRLGLPLRPSCGSIGCLSAVYAARRRELAQWITN